MLHVKTASLVAMLSKLRKLRLVMLGGFLLPLHKLSLQILMVSPKGIFVPRLVQAGVLLILMFYVAE